VGVGVGAGAVVVAGGEVVVGVETVGAVVGGWTAGSDFSPQPAAARAAASAASTIGGNAPAFAPKITRAP
jgi:hypothetical protein